MSDELPEGWAGITLAVVNKGFVAGRNLRAQGRPAEKNEFGVLKISAVTWGDFRPDENKALLPEDSPRPHEQVRRDDLLITRANTSDLVGAVVLVRDDHPRLMIPDKILKLQPDVRLVNPRFLLHALRTRAVRDHFEHNATGTSDSMRNLAQPKINAAPISLPPLAEQHRIVAKVEELLEEVNRAKIRLTNVQTLLKRFRQSVLAAACSGELTREWRNAGAAPIEGNLVRSIHRVLSMSERGRSKGGSSSLGADLADLRRTEPELPPAWVWTPLDAVVRRATDGTHQPPALAPEGVPFLLIGNIQNGRVNWDAISKWVSVETCNALTGRCKPEKGDVLYTAVGATYGQALVVEWDFPFVFQRHIAHVKPLSELIHSAYLALCLNSPRAYARATELARGAAQPTVTLGDIKTLPIPMCSLPEQQEVVRRAQHLLDVADRIHEHVVVARLRADQLPRAILSKAFSGELVPTEAELARLEGRDYEPASVLLERLKADAADGPTKGKKRTTKRPQGAVA